MSNSKKRYDSKYKVTRIHLGDYLALKQIAQVAGTSMAEALHRLIKHQAQLPLLDMAIKPAPAAQVTGIPAPAIRVAGTSAKVMATSANAQLRVTVAGKENGHAQ